MNADDLIELLQPHFPKAEIQAANQGNKFEVLIVDAGFEGKRLVQRQQAVYAIVNPHIQSGAMHALTIHALTPDEYQVKQN
ncbi:BolA/IbaG family iron-sulfur metabolism protein [Moraxella sp. Tifton1]|uniref:BolA family protein n=1 Tax=Moraxella oculi TaxID=2940516 RepID=UPI002012DC10|nr:BolA/IbaG family iron-sulfur metabolism protein [Moraxella sp. Tifton1]MCL1623701.1 BolA/IbaG family iron-sulfur metabolism protein [Moraxella sp. Tifton1]